MKRRNFLSALGLGCVCPLQTSVVTNVPSSTPTLTNLEQYKTEEQYADELYNSIVEKYLRIIKPHEWIPDKDGLKIYLDPWYTMSHTCVSSGFYCLIGFDNEDYNDKFVEKAREKYGDDYINHLSKMVFNMLSVAFGKRQIEIDYYNLDLRKIVQLFAEKTKKYFSRIQPDFQYKIVSTSLSYPTREEKKFVNEFMSKIQQKHSQNPKFIPFLLNIKKDLIQFKDKKYVKFAVMCAVESQDSSIGTYHKADPQFATKNNFSADRIIADIQYEARSYFRTINPHVRLI